MSSLFINILLYLVGKMGEILTPKIYVREDFSCVVCLHKFAYRRVILSHICLVEVKKLCKCEEESFGHLVKSLDVLKNGRKNSYLELGYGVKRDRGEIMLYVGVAEALDYAVCISEKLVARKIEGGNDLIEYALAKMSVHSGIVDTGLNRIKTGKERVRNERGVRAVKNSYLSCAVHLKLIGSDDNVEVRGGERKLAIKIVICLNYPKMEELGCIYHIILVAETEVLAAGIARVNTVNESVGEYILFVYEAFEAIAEIPEISILKNAPLEVISISVNKLAGEENKAVKTELISSLKKKSYLCGEGLGRSVRNLVLRGENDARLCGVGNYKAEIGVLCKREICAKVIIGLNASGDNVTNGFIYAFNASYYVGIYTILSGEHITHTLLDGLNNYYVAVKIGRFIYLLKHPINEAAKEAALAELNNPLGSCNLN